MTTNRKSPSQASWPAGSCSTTNLPEAIGASECVSTVSAESAAAEGASLRGAGTSSSTRPLGLEAWRMDSSASAKRSGTAGLGSCGEPVGEESVTSPGYRCRPVIPAATPKVRLSMTADPIWTGSITSLPRVYRCRAPWTRRARKTAQRQQGERRRNGALSGTTRQNCRVSRAQDRTFERRSQPRQGQVELVRVRYECLEICAA